MVSFAFYMPAIALSRQSHIKFLKKQTVFTVIPDARRRSPSARPCLSFFGKPPYVIPT